MSVVPRPCASENDPGPHAIQPLPLPLNMLTVIPSVYVAWAADSRAKGNRTSLTMSIRNYGKIFAIIELPGIGSTIREATLCHRDAK